MQNNNMGNGQHNPNQRRPQMQNQRPVRPQQGQQSVRPQMQGQQPVRPQGYNGQQPRRPQQGQPMQRPQGQMQGQQRQPMQRPQGQQRQPVRPEYEQSPSRRQPMGYGQEQEYEHPASNNQYHNDNNFEDFNSEVVNDTVAENKARGKKQKVKKEKKVLTPEQKKKRLIIAGIVVGALLIIAVASIFVSKLVKQNNQHINVATEEDMQTPATEQLPEEDTEQQVPDQQETADQGEQEEEQTPSQPSVATIQAKECSSDSPLEIGEYSYMDLIVNTKTAQDTAYIDREAKVYMRMSNMVTGYNAVSQYIDNYNKTNTENKNITLPSVLDYYTQSNGTEIVMLEFELLYPADFPTSASEGIVYRVPVANIKIYGTTEEIDSEDITDDPSNYIVVDDTIYNVSKITDISVYEKDSEKGLKVGEPIVFRYVTALPVGASSDNYGITFGVDLDTEDLGKDTGFYWIKGQSVSGSEELQSALQEIQSQEESEVDTEENTEDSEETESEQ